MTFFRRPWVIVTAILVLGGGLWVMVAKRTGRSPTYDAIVVGTRDIVHEVAVVGTVTAAEEVVLAFERGGRIARVQADVGDRVTAGAVLVTLDQADLLATRAQHQAAVAVERAKLAELRIGTRVEEVHVEETDRENAQRSLVDAETQHTHVIAKASADLSAHYDDASNVLRDANTKADDAVRKQLDELFTNDATTNPQLAFRTTDLQAEIDAERDRRAVEEALAVWPARIATVDAVSTSELDAFLATMSTDLNTVRVFLEHVSATLNASSTLSQATINTYKTNLATARTNTDAARAAVGDEIQAIAVQRVAQSQAIAAAQADVTIARNTLNAAEATLQLTRAGATTEQIAAQEALLAKAEAQVAQTDADLAKTVLRAPFSGMVTLQDARVGTIATAGTSLTTLIADAAFEIDANIPEVDIAGLSVGQLAIVTLDAYGAEHVFPATVAAMDPAATMVEGVATYGTTLVFATEDARIRSGMTADVTIAIDRHNGVLAIPLRAIERRNGTPTVRVLRDGVSTDTPVVVGLRGSDGYAEILEGLVEGDIVVRSE
ncbi:MAG: efflux RND transporter periplasmic adaptor subunit [bacterium]|nr:efflux RND transporter periplasmic adaptor subunit [bacterium]